MVRRVVLIAMNLAGYRNLSRLITRGRRAAAKGDCRLTVEDVAEHAGDLLAIVAPLPRRAAEADDRFFAPLRVAAKQEYRDMFADRAYLAAAVHLGPCDDADLDRFAQQSRQCRLPMIATNQVHYHVPVRRPLHDVLTAVRHHTTVANLGALRFPNGERYLKSPAQMAQLFARYPDAIRRTVEAADRCNFSLDELRYEYPDELCPDGKTPTGYLAELTWAGITNAILLAFRTRFVNCSNASWR